MEWGVTLDDYFRCKQTLLPSFIKHFFQVATPNLIHPALDPLKLPIRAVTAMLTVIRMTIQAFSVTKQMAYANQVIKSRKLKVI